MLVTCQCHHYACFHSKYQSRRLSHDFSDNIAEEVEEEHNAPSSRELALCNQRRHIHMYPRALVALWQVSFDEVSCVPRASTAYSFHKTRSTRPLLLALYSHTSRHAEQAATNTSNMHLRNLSRWCCAPGGRACSSAQAAYLALITTCLLSLTYAARQKQVA